MGMFRLGAVLCTVGRLCRIIRVGLLDEGYFNLHAHSCIAKRTYQIFCPTYS